jgi:drug/metabolite transporter (DMT)-like permease
MSNRINPVVVNGLRCAYATVITAIIILVLGRQNLLLSLPAEGVTLIVISGMLGQGLGDAIFVVSMKLIGAARAMPISSTQPLLTTILAVIFLGERVTWLGAVGTALVLCSIYLLAFPYGPLSQVGRMIAGADRRGVLLALGAAVCWAFSSIMLRQAVGSIDVLSTNLIRMVVAAIMLLGFESLVFRGEAAAGVDRRGLAVMALAGLLGTFSSLGYVTAITYAGAAKAAVLASTSPLFGLPLSIFVLRERINGRILFGSLLCVFGICLVLVG